MKKQIFYMFAGVILAIFSGCKSFDEYQDERINKAVAHFERAQYTDIKPDHVFSYNECVKLAIKNNLDLKIFGLEEKVSNEMRTSEFLGMLPELTVSNNLTRRTNTPAASSEQIHGDGAGSDVHTPSSTKVNRGMTLPSRSTVSSHMAAGRTHRPPSP